jgi:hypothetical protein
MGILKKPSLISTAALLAVASISPNAAVAVENGTSAANDPRILPVYTDFNPNGDNRNWITTCSAFLLTSRIVVTAQHCTINGSGGSEKLPKDFVVGKPGELTTNLETNKFRASAMYRMANFQWSNIATDHSFHNDVAIAVFDKDISPVADVKFLTREQYEDLRSKGAGSWIGGYGYQSVEHRSQNGKPIYPAKAASHFISEQVHKAAVLAHFAKTRRTYYDEKLWGMAFDSYATGTICDRDSGSSYFAVNGSDVTYLGLANGPLSITNCMANGMPPWTEPMMGFYPTFVFQDLLDQAFAYVSAHPIAKPIAKPLAKQTIVCMNGKLSKKVTAVKPVCPKGYKKVTK